MNQASRQKLLLGILGVLLLVAAWRYLGPALGGGEDVDTGVSTRAPFDPEAADEPVAARRLPGARRSGSTQGDPGRVAELRLSDLQRVPPSYSPGRDPWRFVLPPPPPPPPPPPGPTAEELRAMEEARLRAAEAARLAAEEAARIAAIPKPPEFTLQYMGSFGPANRRIAVFTDGKKIYNLQEGQVLEGKFIVARIGFESVEIKFVNFPDEPAKRLPIQGRR